MKRVPALVALLALLFAATVSAEYRQIDLSIFGMD